MNQTPLLLKYKQRDCYTGEESEINPDSGVWISDLTRYMKTPSRKIWKLQRDGICLQNRYGEIRYFYRREFHAVGDPNPVIVWFDRAGLDADDRRTRTYHLPKNFRYSPLASHFRFDIYEDLKDDEGLEVPRIFHEYERHRGRWKPRVLVERGEK